jgi:predicted integral membrane protein DUF2269
MLQLFLFLHVMGAIAVFGPTFAFPLIARQAQRAPEHGNFAATVTHLIESRVVVPGAVVQGITGVALILIIGADLTQPAFRWLIAGIVLYLIAILFAIFVQTPAAERMVHLTTRPAGAPAGPPAGAPAGPPPGVLETGRQLQRGGMLLTVLIVLIVILMVTKPGF